jgi:hypothetical protein
MSMNAAATQVGLAGLGQSRASVRQHRPAGRGEPQAAS